MKKLGVALAVAWSSVSMAMPPDQPTYAMFGQYDCGQWFDPGKRVHATAWLLGYLGGQSMMFYAVVNHWDPLDELGSAEQAYLWMDNWCRANPLEGIAHGADVLFRELALKRSKRK